MPIATKTPDWAVLPYNTKKISNKYLVNNLLGCWDLLDLDEFKRLEQFRFEKSDALFSRLHDKGLIVKEDNLAETIADFRNLHAHLFTDASLHIVVLTTRCNIACNYCQTREKNPKDMNIEVAAQVLKYCFDMRSPYINLEFQGGEPLLNWKTMKYIIEQTPKFKNVNKTISINLVTNGTLLNDKKIEFLVDKGISICISMDGPAKVHDRNRIFSGGDGSYKKVTAAIKKLKAAYDKRKMNSQINLLPTLNRQSLPFAREIIDEYVKWGVDQVALRPMNKMGGAQCQWENIGYTPEEFNQFWAEAMDYILELNKRGIHLEERMATVMLKKILNKKDPGYVDLMSPCGAGRAVLTYMPNGDIYPCDEARMVTNNIFKLGNVLKNNYEDIIKSPKLFSVCESSVMDLWSYNSAYLPWMGTCPVLNYISQGNIVPKITQTPKYKIHHFQFEYLFKKMIENKQNLKIFQKWAG